MKKPKPKKPIKHFNRYRRRLRYLGTYDLGGSNIDVFLKYGETGGDYISKPTATGLPRILVGMLYPQNQWAKIVTILYHEAMEYVLMNFGARYEPDCEFWPAHATYMFVFNHNVFTEATARVGEFMIHVIPDIATKFNAQFPKQSSR